MRKREGEGKRERTTDELQEMAHETNQSKRKEMLKRYENSCLAWQYAGNFQLLLSGVVVLVVVVVAAIQITQSGNG